MTLTMILVSDGDFAEDLDVTDDFENGFAVDGFDDDFSVTDDGFVKDLDVDDGFDDDSTEDFDVDDGFDDDSTEDFDVDDGFDGSNVFDDDFSEDLDVDLRTTLLMTSFLVDFATDYTGHLPVCCALIVIVA